MTSADFLNHFAPLADAPGGVQKLRTFVLKLAFSGRLAGVSPMSEWRHTTVGEIATELQPGFACSKKNENPKGYVHLRTHNVATDGRLNFDLIIRVEPEKIDPRRASLKTNDVIFNNTNSKELVGKTCLVDRDYGYAFSNHLTVMRFEADVEPGFIVRYFNWLLRTGFFAAYCNRWIGQAGINIKMLKTIEVKLPLLAEQRRIVAKVDELMRLCDQLETRQAEQRAVRVWMSAAALDRLTQAADPAEFAPAWQRLNRHFDTFFAVPESIVQLRQTLLQLAVMGKLVSGFEQVTSVESSVNGSERLPFEIPSRWKWANLQDVASHRLGKMLDKAKNSGEPHPYLRNTNVHWFRIALGDIKTMRFRGDELEEYELHPGDVLICEGGHGIGRTAVWTAGKAGMKFQKALHRVRPSDHLNSHFFAFCMKVYADTDHIRTYFTGSGIPHLTGRSLGKLVFPLPPREEQDAIVERVQSLNQICDALEAQLARRETWATELLEAMVAAILEGERAVSDPQVKRPSRTPTPTRTEPPKPRVAAPDFVRTRTALSCYIVDRLHREKNFHRTNHAKILSVAQAHAGIDMGIPVERWQYGPFHEYIFDLEDTAQREKWYSHKGRKTVRYKAHRGIKDQVKVAVELLGEKQAELDRLLSLFAKLSTYRAELYATTYFAWNDLLLDGKKPTKSTIAAGFYAWHESKAKFSKAKIAQAIEWLKDNDLAPTGKGQRTLPMSKEEAGL